MIPDPLPPLAELTQHIPNKGEHLIRYYGCYSNKARGVKVKQAAAEPSAVVTEPAIATSPKLIRRRWAMLIKRIYHTDPLLCPKCGGTMKIISFIEARQDDVIRKILQHCGLWHDPPTRAPPTSGNGSRPVRAAAESGFRYEADPDFLEQIRREQSGQLDLPW